MTNKTVDFSTTELEALSEEDLASVLETSALSKTTQRAVLAAELELHWFATNPYLTPDIQAALVRDPRTWLQECLAINTGLTPSLQMALARSADPTTRGGLAGNTSITPAAQRVLAKDSDATVRMGLACNASLVANPALEVSADFPLGFLKECYVGRELIAERMSTERVDLEDAAALTGTWAGTLGELIATCAELAGEA